jgi:hypothetical protein
VVEHDIRVIRIVSDPELDVTKGYNPYHVTVERHVELPLQTFRKSLRNWCTG